MKKQLLLLAAVFVSCTLLAQDYKVTFSANGLATETDSVEIENVTQGKSITVYGQDTLHLLGIVSSAESMESSTDVKLYPNPATGHSHLEFFSPEGGTAKLMISDVSGKHLLTRHLETQPGTNRIRISGLKRGTYLLALHQQGMQHTRKLTVTSGHGGILQTEISSTGTTGVSTKSVKADGLVEWQYDDEDILIFTGYGNGHSRIHVYYISLDTDVVFNLISCEDPDGHKYTVTTIGGVTWMAENLRTTKLNNNVPISQLTDSSLWNNSTEPARCYIDNDSATNAKDFGSLYNYYAVGSGNLCPTGWHVPTETEFQELLIYLQNNGYNYDGSIDTDNDHTTNNHTAKSLSRSQHWYYSDTIGAPGNTEYPDYTNRSGMSIIGSGMRNPVLPSAGGENSVGTFWSSTEANPPTRAYRLTTTYNNSSSGISRAYKNFGLSVRCVMD